MENYALMYKLAKNYTQTKQNKKAVPVNGYDKAVKALEISKLLTGETSMSTLNSYKVLGEICEHLKMPKQHANYLEKYYICK